MNNYIAHILVVDDDDGIRSLVQQYLTKHNFLVTTASNAEEALESIKQGSHPRKLSTFHVNYLLSVKGQVAHCSGCAEILQRTDLQMDNFNTSNQLIHFNFNMSFSISKRRQLCAIRKANELYPPSGPE